MIFEQIITFNFTFFKNLNCAFFLLSFCKISHYSLVLNYTENPAQMKMDAWWWHENYFFKKYWSAAFQRTSSLVFWTNTCWAMAIWSSNKILHFSQKVNAFHKVFEILALQPLKSIKASTRFGLVPQKWQEIWI